jgi:hypothetical protein
MPIAIECIDCGFTAVLKDHLGGKVVECPKCKAGIEVGQPAPVSAAPVSASPESSTREDAAPRSPDR